MVNYLSLIPNENLMEHMYKEYYKSKIDKLKKNTEYFMKNKII